MTDLVQRIEKIEAELDELGADVVQWVDDIQQKLASTKALIGVLSSAVPAASVPKPSPAASADRYADPNEPLLQKIIRHLKEERGNQPTSHRDMVQPLQSGGWKPKAANLPNTIYAACNAGWHKGIIRQHKSSDGVTWSVIE